MTPERWRLVEAAFDKISSLPLDERQDALNELDDSLHSDVEPLLAQDERTGATLQSVIAAGSRIIRESNTTQYGRWRTTGIIGHGGMGTVYSARRDDSAFEKQVAVKVLHEGIASPAMRERFAQERQILATLEHPNIARLLDGGETADGIGYIVLEYVDGKDILSYCDSRALTIPDRLRIFLKVCEAVAWAHRNLVVHRDLKPGNILVTESGEPKLLDFGIAKLLGPGLDRTVTAMQALTPQYASPEQILGRPITTASDVYSLGVVLFELLTQRRPYDLAGRTPSEAENAITRTPPAAPGLGNDLDNILSMALRKEPERRYDSVQQFAADLERFLGNRPVLARADTRWYRTGKFVRRNRLALALAAAVAVATVAGVVALRYQAQRAERRFQQVRQLANRFMDFHDEVAKTPGTLKAREMIVSTAIQYLNSLSSEVSDDPGLQWELAHAWGKVAAAQGSNVAPSLGRWRDAAQSYGKALALARPLAARNALNNAQMHEVVDILTLAGALELTAHDYARAGVFHQEALAISARFPANERVSTSQRLAMYFQRKGDLVTARQGILQALSVLRNAGGPAPSFKARLQLAETVRILGIVQHRLTKFDEAEKSLRESEGIFRILVQEQPDNTAVQRQFHVALYNLGDLYGACDRPNMLRPTEAAAHYREAIQVVDKVAATDSQDRNSTVDAALARNKLACLLVDSLPREALAEASAAARILADTGQPSEAFLVQARIAIADSRRALGDFLGAAAELNQLQAALARIDPNTRADASLAWARLEDAQGNRDRANLLFDTAVAQQEELYRQTPTPPYAWNLARCLEFAAAQGSRTQQKRQELRRRIREVWEEQDTRYPGSAYLAARFADARSREK